jgi:hypothetical protein
MPASRSFATGKLAVAVAALLAVAACGGSTAVPTPPSSTGPAAATAAPAPATVIAPASAPAAPASVEATTEATQPSTGGTGDLGDAAANLSNISSFKFKIKMAGGSFGSLLGTDPITGSVTTNPKAAQMSLMGMEYIEVGDKSWVKIGDTWTANDGDSSSSLADSFAPEKMFGSVLSGSAASGYHSTGDEQKNGVSAVHYQADASAIAEYAGLFGVKGNASWSSDVWIAKDGGYPVSMSVIATGGTETFEMTFDISNINDPSIKIETPA